MSPSKSPLIVLACGALGVGLAACGASSGGSAASSPGPAAAATLGAPATRRTRPLRAGRQLCRGQHHRGQLDGVLRRQDPGGEAHQPAARTARNSPRSSSRRRAAAWPRRASAKVTQVTVNSASRPRWSTTSWWPARPRCRTSRARRSCRTAPGRWAGQLLRPADRWRAGRQDAGPARRVPGRGLGRGWSASTPATAGVLRPQGRPGARASRAVHHPVPDVPGQHGRQRRPGQRPDRPAAPASRRCSGWSSALRPRRSPGPCWPSAWSPTSSVASGSC